MFLGKIMSDVKYCKLLILGFGFVGYMVVVYVVCVNFNFVLIIGI